MKLRPGFVVTRRIRRLDPVDDADEIARLSLVVLHGSPLLTYALFTVAFMKQVAVPTMARILHRRGTGDILQFPVDRNDDTLLFFGRLLDHGPTSPTGLAWIERLNDIHSHFPLRNDDSLYTLSTLALDPHRITSSQGFSPFSKSELEAQWRFWRSVAELQCLTGLPASRQQMQRWAADYERREYASTPEGRDIARSLIAAFGERVLPPRLRRHAESIISAVAPEELRTVHALPEPSWVMRSAIRLAVLGYTVATPIRPVDLDRLMVTSVGPRQASSLAPSQVGYRRRIR
ncbi:oxygenase MpaB family protein [Rhodococcoides fascians]|uniref:oxygenase MpaB family protein n=1 Tax=Rhodococcoides fascians TaxID=1828 RepID=UPI0009B7F6FE|nr:MULTISPECIES: oxygenase MpaB family protein [Rhodococcus]OZF04824.1 DUF2236 domain-containing protein [Rhodococcus sp. 15-1189-1-1a]OZF19089.1 DUF2236 domain-containing protein [Rhodococcus sp. 14-2686-1-2]